MALFFRIPFKVKSWFNKSQLHFFHIFICLFFLNITINTILRACFFSFDIPTANEVDLWIPPFMSTIVSFILVMLSFLCGNMFRRFTIFSSVGTQHHRIAPDLFPKSQTAAQQSVRTLAVLIRWLCGRGMALQQGHKSFLWQSHCQHSAGIVDKARCSPQHKAMQHFRWGMKQRGAVPPESVWSILVKKKIWKVTELFQERVCELLYRIINIYKMFSWTVLGQEVNAS